MQTIKDMTDEELMAIAGDESVTDISQVSDDELMKIADVQPQKPLRKADLLDQVLPRPIAENLGLIMRGLPNRGPAQFEQGDLNLLGDIVERPAKAMGGFIAPRKGESRVDAYIRGSVDPGSVDSFVEKSQGSQVFSDPETPIALQFAAGYARDLAGFGIDVATNPSNYIPVGMIAKNLNVAAKQVTGIFGKRPGMIVVPRTEIAKPAARMLSTEFMPMTSEGVVDQAIDIGIVKSIRPSVSGKQGMGDVVRYKNQARDAVKTIVENKNDLLLEDYSGNLTKKLPETVNEFAQSIGQTKSLVYKEYSNLIKEAGENNAVVALDPVVAEMQKIAMNKSLLMKDPELAKYAAGVAERFQGVGKMGPDEADDLVTLYNQSLKAFYSHPTYESASKAAIDAMVVNKLRKALDETVEGATGEAFQVLKNKYGALKAIEKDVVNRAIVAGRQNVKGLIDFSDIFSAGDVVNGILSMRPELIAKGVAQNQVKNYWRKLNSPDRQISTMFRTVDRHHVAVPRSVRRTAEVVEDSPVEQFLPKITNQGGKPRLPGGGAQGLPDKTPTPGSFRMIKGEPVQSKSMKDLLKEDKGSTGLKALAIPAAGAAGLSAYGAIRPGEARASQDIDMNKIYQIESSNNPKAFNKGSKARGLGQITPIVLKEWNNFHPKETHTSDDLYDSSTNKKIAHWYMNKRIPQMMKRLKIEDTTENRLIAYNAGIGRVGKILPTETANYIKKYNKK